MRNDFRLDESKENDISTWILDNIVYYIEVTID